jgi:hypothetical protein
MEIPKTIYRYQGANLYSLKNLKAQSLYMASPLGFNDPYDCALSTRINEISDVDWQRLVSHYANEGGLLAAAKQRMLSIYDAELKSMGIGSVKSAIGINQLNFLKLRGVTCFSEKKDDLLMWGHYGDGYRGFCLEFRAQGDLFEKIREVKYVDQIPAIDVVSLLIDKDVNHVDLLYCTKSIKWQYEKEWRLIHEKVGTLYCYPAETLKAIYFGPKIDNEIKEIICLIMQGQNPNVEFWQGELSKTEFKVEFKKVSYTPHIAVKKCG